MELSQMIAEMDLQMPSVKILVKLAATKVLVAS